MQKSERMKNRWLGMKIMSAGFILLLSGALLAWAGFESGALFVIGILVGLAGFVVHSLQFFRETLASKPWK
jgi:hypothetical protein